MNLLVEGDERLELLETAKRQPLVKISPRAVCDLELLAVGAFSPLDRFMRQADYDRVLEEMRLENGALFPLPVSLVLPDSSIPPVGDQITLCDARSDILAILQIEEVYPWNPEREARLGLGTNDSRHPLVSEMPRWGSHCVSGTIKMLNMPRYHDFKDLRLSPVEVRQRLFRMGNEKVVAFQTRNPLHRVHEEITKQAAEAVGGSLLIHPVVGLTKPGDVDHYTRVRIYRALVERYYDPATTLLSLLPLAMRMAGPKEALLHALIRRNYGATHFIIGRNHASPGNDSLGKLFYEPYAAQEMLIRYAGELGVEPVPFKELVYLPEHKIYMEGVKAPTGAKVATISGTQVREDYLAKGNTLPEWFTRPETAEILRQAYPPRHKQGFCIWFTGLSGAGKSSTAEVLTSLLMERGRRVTHLDGDLIRTHLSRGLGFSREDRDTNILRIGFVASEIVRHGGAVICAAISPYRATRNEVRRMVGKNMVMVYLNTPLEVCEQRDTKGMYARARRGELKGFTGIDDPFEPPVDPELTIDTSQITPEESANQIIRFLDQRQFLIKPGE